MRIEISNDREWLLLFAMCVFVILHVFNLIGDLGRNDTINQMKETLPETLDQILEQKYPYLVRNSQDYDVMQSNIRYLNYIAVKMHPRYEDEIDVYEEKYKRGR